MHTIFTLDVILYVFKLWFEYLLWCIPLAVCTMLMLAPMLAILVRINLWLAGYKKRDGKWVGRPTYQNQKKGDNNGTDD